MDKQLYARSLWLSAVLTMSLASLIFWLSQNLTSWGF